MKTNYVFYLLILFMATVSNGDVYNWTGTSDNDVFNELNWELDGSPGTNIPQIDPDVVVNHDLVIASGTPVIDGTSFAAPLDLGPGVGSLTITGGFLDAMVAGRNNGVRADADGTNWTNCAVLMTGTAQAELMFILDIDMTLTDSATLNLGGGGNPVNRSTIDIAGPGVTVNFLAETVAAFTSEHLGKFTVAGEAAVIGTNLNVVSDGGSGCIVTPVASVFNAPILVYPVGDENQPWDLTLEWLAPPPFVPAGYNIYLDPNEYEVSIRNPDTKYNTVLDPDINHDVTGLAHGERYYWLVEARQDPLTTPPSDPNCYASGVATFTTLPDDPLFDTSAENQGQPISQTVPIGNPITQLKVATLQTTNWTWWYKAGDGVAAVDLTTVVDPQIAGADTDTLTISNITTGHEGNYWCVASNGSGSITSNKALLMTERLAAQWSFESSIDAVVGSFTGTYVDPNDLASAGAQFNNTVASPAGGYALQLSGDTVESEGGGSGELVEISDPNFFNFYPQGLTVSTWVSRVDDGETYACIVSKQRRATSPWRGWVMNLAVGPYANFNMRQANAARAGNIDLTGVNEDLGNNWHLVTGTYDGEVTRIYVDGNLETESNAFTGSMETTALPLRIGAETSEGVSPWNGLIDDLQIYTYALSRVDVAKSYTNLVPGAEICTSDPVLEDADFNDDCIVNLKDFAEFAVDWLDCGIVPTCLP